MSVKHVYAALLKIAAEDEYKDLGVDMKSDESGVDNDDKKRKKQREQPGFISPAGAGTAAGVLGALGIAAATPGGRKALKGVKGGMEAAVAKVINKIREKEAPDSIFSDYAWLPAAGGILGAGTLWNRAYGLQGTPSRSRLIGALERAREHVAPQAGIPGARPRLERVIREGAASGIDPKHLDALRDIAADIHSDPVAAAKLNLIDDALAQLRLPLTRRRRLAGRDILGRRTYGYAFNRRIFDNPDLRDVLLDVEKDLGGMPLPGGTHTRRGLTGHMNKTLRRIHGYGGLGLLALGTAWSGALANKNYEKRKGRAH